MFALEMSCPFTLKSEREIPGPKDLRLHSSVSHLTYTLPLVNSVVLLDKMPVYHVFVPTFIDYLSEINFLFS